MILTLIRYKDTGNATLGKLFIDAVPECFTLEDEFRENKVKGETRIPAGVYSIDLRHSPKFTPKYGHEMLWIKDVPGFEYILIHKGNTEKDTKGCVLVGSAVFKDTIVSSGKAYEDLYPKVSKEVRAGRPVLLAVIDYDRT